VQQKDHPNRRSMIDFLTALATCHTVIPEKDETTGKIVYQCSSPDEVRVSDYFFLACLLLAVFRVVVTHTA